MPQETERVKCVRIKAYKGAPVDPELELGTFYDVIDTEQVMGQDTWLVVKKGNVQLSRPRHMFSRILKARR